MLTGMVVRGMLAGALLAGALALAGCAGGGSAPEPTPTTVAGSSVEVTGPTSYAVWSSVVENFPDGITTSSPLYPVSALEDITPDTVRVIVQQRLDDPRREIVARQVFSLGAVGTEELHRVVVQDASGVDSNHSR